MENASSLDDAVPYQRLEMQSPYDYVQFTTMIINGIDVYSWIVKDGSRWIFPLMPDQRTPVKDFKTLKGAKRNFLRQFGKFVK